MWKKAFAESWVQLLLSSLLLGLFGWAFVWLMSLLKMGAWSTMLNLLPNFVQPLLGVPIAELATAAGQISFLYVHVITLLICIGWAVGRGSASISGEITRGTMDLILTLPVRRVSVLVVPAVVSTLGAAVLAAAVWGGTVLGLVTVDFGTPISVGKFFPGAVNLFSMTFCLTGITAFFSSFNRDRWRTISLAVGFFVISLLLDLVSRLWQSGAWLKYLTFLTAFDPQALILAHGGVWEMSLWMNLTLFGLGLICYAAGAIVLSYRDIPAAL